MANMHRLVIITGASKGIGAQIALQTNQKFNDKQTTFLLVARDLAKLNEVANEMTKANSLSEVLTMSYDFSQVAKTEDLKNLLNARLKQKEAFDELYVFYNHGTLKIDSVEKVADQATNEFQINVISVWTLMSALREMFPLNSVKKQFHINISSLLATALDKMCSVYCSTRIARATMFKCLALEQPELRVLNYQPGPVYTDMLKQIHDNIETSNQCKSDQKITMYDNFTQDYDAGRLLTAEVTVRRMLDIIEKNEFQNGSSIDYFDEI